MQKELTRIRRERLTTQELADARLVYQRLLAQRFETIDGAVEAASEIALYDLPVDDYALASSRFARVTVDDVQAAANRYLAPERLRLFILGDAARFRSQIETLGIGTVSVVASKAPALPELSSP
jgi:zinc protease